MALYISGLKCSNDLIKLGKKEAYKYNFGDYYTLDGKRKTATLTNFINTIADDYQTLFQLSTEGKKGGNSRKDDLKNCLYGALGIAIKKGYSYQSLLNAFYAHRWTAGEYSSYGNNPQPTFRFIPQLDTSIILQFEDGDKTYYPRDNFITFLKNPQLYLATKDAVKYYNEKETPNNPNPNNPNPNNPNPNNPNGYIGGSDVISIVFIILAVILILK